MNRVSAPSLPPINCLQIDHLYILSWYHLIKACRCLSNPAWSRPWSGSPSSLDQGIEVYLPTNSIMASESASSWPWRAPQNSQDHGLQVHLPTRYIMAAKCTSKLTESWTPSESLSSLDPCLQVHLETHSIMALECISEFTQSSSFCAPRVDPKHRLQLVQIYHV